jgi:hypothetical protein
MTEAEWVACEDPKALLEHFRDRFSNRKLRLFGCACCLLVWEHLKDECRAAVRVAERYADGVADDTERWAARAVADRAVADPATDSAESQAAISLTNTGAFDAAYHASFEAAGRGYVFGAPGRNENDEKQFLAERAVQTTLLRDIFGNPFRPVAFALEWRTDTAVSLARQMYESRDFGAMPILADALQDAGCDGEDILAHCRDPKQVHVRGCWVVDLILGKE